MSRALDVYLNNQLAGGLVQDNSGQLIFSYVTEYLHSKDAIPLSQSLPLGTTIFKNKSCRPFFAGILPESSIREIIAKNLGISPRNDFSMLEKIGGECAGAITFLPKGMIPPKLKQNDYHHLSDKELAVILTELHSKPLLAGDKGVRLSLAGAQDKIAVALINDQIYLPLNGAPSSHIIKPAIKRFNGIVQNETFCMQLAAALGIPTAHVAARQVAEIEYLLIERYDRYHTTEGVLQRVHQEDFCQALGIPPELKYQNEGGPSLSQCVGLIKQCSSAPTIDIRNLLDAVILNYLIGNNDAHGKNFSLIYTPNGVRYAPLYDIISTIVYPELSTKMAMKIGSTYKYNEVNARQWEKMSAACGFSPAIMNARIKEMQEKVATTAKQLASEIESRHEIIDKIVLRLTHRRAI